MKTIIILIGLLISPFTFAQGDQLQVGLAAVDVAPKIGVPLAGYGSPQRRLPGYVDWRNRYPEAFLFRPSVGIHSPIRAKTMVLRKGLKTMVFISLDTIGLELSFIKDLAKRLARYGIKEKDILASATHTHGGPGTLSRRLPLEVIAVDLFKRGNYENALNKVVSSVESAFAAMRPADFYKTSAIINDVQRNKWRRQNEEHFDKKASFLVAKSRTDGKWMGGLVNFSIHGGTMPIGLLHLSSDINGAIEKELETLFDKMNASPKGAVFLFMNGAEGDVGSIGERGVEMIDLLSKRFIDQASSAFSTESLTPVAPDFFIARQKIFLGIPALDLKCQGGLFKDLPMELRLGIWPLMPATSVISLAQVGDITMLSWPGEPSTQLGFDLQNKARALGAKDPWVVSLANDYTTYYTTPSEYQERAYDSCSTLYGPKSAQRIIWAHQALLKWYLKTDRHGL